MMAANPITEQHSSISVEDQIMTKTVADVDAEQSRFQQVHDRIAQVLQRDINILNESSSDRLSKRRSLERIYKEVCTKADAEVNPEVLSMLFKTLSKPLLRSLSDSVEKCRELSIAIVSSLVKKVYDIHGFLAYIVPAFKDRLGGLEVSEPSEEIRLSMVKALHEMIIAAGPSFSPFVDDIVTVLLRVLLDTYPEVKKESLRLLVDLSNTCSRPLQHHAGSLAKTIIPSLQHRHSSVRTVALRGLSAIIIVDAAGLDDSLEPLWVLTMDGAPSVRETLYAVSRDWLTKLTDRYTFGYKILPLLLAGLTEQVPKLADLAEGFMDEVGALYEKEWESRIKDEMDYSDGWDHLPNRPRVGSRHVVRDNLQKIVNKLVDGLGNWSADARGRACRILKSLLRFTEDQITGYVNLLLPPLIKILASDEAFVVQEALIVCEKLGEYVHPDTTTSMLIQQIQIGGSAAVQFRIGCLRVLERLTKGSDSKKLESVADRIISTISEYDMLYHENHLILLEITRVISHLIAKIDLKDVNDADLSYRLFYALIFISSVPGDDKNTGYADLQKESASALISFQTTLALPSVEYLTATYLQRTLNDISAMKEQWTKHSYDFYILKTVTLQSGPALGSHLPLFLDLISFATSPDRDYDVREKGLTILLACVSDCFDNIWANGLLGTSTTTLLSSIVIPNLIWRAGRRPAQLRGIAMTLLHKLLTSTPSSISTSDLVGALRVDVLSDLLSQQLLPHVISCLDEDDVAVRGTTLLVIKALLQSNVKWAGEDFKKLYPELLKRLDDAIDTLRISAANVFDSFFACGARWLERMKPFRDSANPQATSVQGPKGELLEVSLDNCHWETIVQGMVIHMDDTNNEIQVAVTNALKTGISNGVLPKDFVYNHLKSVKTRHRSTRYIDEIVLVD